MNRKPHHLSGYPSLSAFIREQLPDCIWQNAEEIRVLCESMCDDADTDWSEHLINAILSREYQRGTVERKKQLFPYSGNKGQYLYRRKDE